MNNTILDQNDSLGFEIFRETTHKNSTPQTLYSSSITIGCVVAGHKLLYHNGKQISIKQNNLFILGIGSYHEENIVNNGGKFEQITFQITPQRLLQTLFGLRINFGLSLLPCNSSTRFHDYLCLTIPVNEQLHDFFEKIGSQLPLNNTIKHIKLNELIYLLATSGDENIKMQLLRYSDPKTTQFIATIYDNLFANMTIEELAKRMNCSLTTFKRNFNMLFGLPPRKWITEQRLERANFLAKTTDYTISEMAYKCGFTNISHFINLFKRHFGKTPKEVSRERNLRQGEV